jgi:nucleolar GTP-binding protein
VWTKDYKCFGIGDIVFKHIPTYTSQEIVDKAFAKAKRVSVKRGKDWQRKIEIAKVSTACTIASSSLAKIIKRFPSLNNLSPFYAGLCDILVGNDMLKKNLGALQWAEGRIAQLRKEYTIKMKKSNTNSETLQARRQCYARLNSVLKQIEPNLAFLAEAREKIKQLPRVEEDLFTVVIAGFPNVGKSFILKRLTGADPDIQPYPFTTKGINVGYMPHRHLKIQFIDTPGLLDRPLAKRNQIERLAINALKNLSNLVLFVIDSSEMCGYTLLDQMSLLEEIKGIFPHVIVVNNKCDIARNDDFLNISAQEGEGVEGLKNIITEHVKKSTS